MNSMSGTASSGRVLTKACRPPGTTVAGADAVEIRHQHAHRHAVEPHLAVEHAGDSCARIGHVGADMVLQILADRQVGDAGDPHLAQMRRRPDAGQHQELRRVERAAGDDDFAFASARLRSPESLTYSTPVARVPCIRSRVACAPVSTVEVVRALGRPQIGARGRRAPAVADGVLAAAETFLLLAVVILGERIAGLLARPRARRRRSDRASWRIGCRAAPRRRARCSRRSPRSRRD